MRVAASSAPRRCLPETSSLSRHAWFAGRRVRTEASVTVEDARAFEIRIEPRDKKKSSRNPKGAVDGPVGRLARKNEMTLDPALIGRVEVRVTATRVGMGRIVPYDHHQGL